jgi:two-component sensor histidine kinase
MVDPSAGPLIWDSERLRFATDAAGVALWSWNVDTDEIIMDQRAHGLWGVPAGAVTFKDLSARIHPQDLDRVRAAFAATREVLGAYEIDFRILHGGSVRWVSARGRGDDQGIVGRLMYGIFLEVTERKRAEEAREMLAGEMAHRVKNLMSITSALIGIAERSTATTTAMSRDLRQRLVALSRAHDLVSPVLSQPKKAVHLAELVEVLLSPYDEDGSMSGRIRVEMPALLVGEASATTLALVVHELATNALKYGALSAPTGTLEVTGTVDGTDVVITWRESGGPPVSAPTEPSGFGRQLVARSISGQLGGSIDYAWPVTGVIVTVRTTIARLGG